jgi:hypothetical protein
MAREISFWCNNSPLQELADKVGDLIPREGDIKGYRNRKLERWRKAVNAYYDLYNNGLCNRAQSFSKLFKMAPSQHMSGWNWKCKYRYYTQADFRRIGEIIEPKMEQMCIDAAIEQGIITEKAAQLLSL